VLVDLTCKRGMTPGTDHCNHCWLVDNTEEGREWIMHGQGSSVTQLTWRTPCSHHKRLCQTHLLLRVFSIHCVQQAQLFQVGPNNWHMGFFQGGMILMSIWAETNTTCSTPLATVRSRATR
jgi:hypothetical protein